MKVMKASKNWRNIFTTFVFLCKLQFESEILELLNGVSNLKTHKQ